MDPTHAVCRDDRRRDVLREDGRSNGIDYVEVDTDDPSDPVLQVFLLGRLPDDPHAWLEADNFKITCSDAAHELKVVNIAFHNARDDERDDRITVTLNGIGDASTYTLHLSGTDERPLHDIDPCYKSAPFSLVADDSPAEVDCVMSASCPPDQTRAPDLNYLAKDYASFRQLLLDRLATALPDWRERHSPDLYLTLVEVLAYHADHLSYAQDAVATEAYLDTARFRTSVRRHARLVDYRMHEGCNARAWLALAVKGDPTVRADQVQFLTRPNGLPETTTVLFERDVQNIPQSIYEIFEPLPEKGWEEIVEKDIQDPQALAKRLLNADTLEIRALRELMDDTTRRALRSALENGSPELVRIEVSFLRLLLDDPNLGDADGTALPLRGAAGRRHNRCTLQEIFPNELLQPARYRFRQAHNRISFHTWHRVNCCLPVGATGATLRDHWVDKKRERRGLDGLAIGDVLILEELVNPQTGKESDVNPSHRHPVRLTEVRRETDPLGDIPVVEVSWADADALPFSLPISTVGPAPQCAPLDDLSVARGNVVLVDHGETVRQWQQPELLDGARTFLAVPFDPPDDVVPSQGVEWCCAGANWLDESPIQASRYAPRLARGPLVFAVALPKGLPSAREVLEQEPRRARPQVALFSPVDRKLPWMDVLTRNLGEGVSLLYERWLPRLDLLDSDANDRHFVVEIDDDRTARIRFGDGELGARPVPDVRYFVWYRVGGGPAGNVGRDAINCLILRGTVEGGTIVGVRNPLPARGGTAPERVSEVRLRAPHDFRTTLQRAITLDDYAAIALRDFPCRIRRAAARYDAVKNNRTQVRLLIDPLGTTEDDTALRQDVAKHMRRFARIGHQLQVLAAEYVPIDLTLRVRLAPYYQWGDVLGALRSRFGNGRRPDGGFGFFHPDRISFGQPVAVSTIVAEAMDIPGVAAARVVNLAKHKEPPSVPATDVFELDEPWQIVRLDNDPNRPANGVLRIEKEPES